MQPNTQVNEKTLKNINFFSRREMRELPSLLIAGEQVLAVVSGWYTAGVALLCITSHRVLLIDKKFMRLSFEDVRYESVQEVNYSQETMLASLRLYFSGRNLHFRSWHRHGLRRAAQMVQQKMFDFKSLPRQQEQPSVAGFGELADGGTSGSVPQVHRDVQEIPYTRSAQYAARRFDRWQRAGRLSGLRILALKTGGRVVRLAVQADAKQSGFATR